MALRPAIPQVPAVVALVVGLLLAMVPLPVFADQSPAGAGPPRITTNGSLPPPGELDSFVPAVQAATRAIDEVRTALAASPREVVPLRGADASRAMDLDVRGNQLLYIDRDQTVGNITVSDDSILWVENASRVVTLTVQGDILLQGNGTLIVHKARMRADQAYHMQYSYKLTGTAHLTVVNGNVTTNGYQWPGALYGDSNQSVIASEFCVTPSWCPVTPLENATLLLLYSYYFADIVGWGLDPGLFVGVVLADNVYGINLWLAFPSGSSADMSLPPPFGWVGSWMFPGAFSASGIGYNVVLNNTFVGIFATMQWPGSSVTISDSAGFLPGFFPVGVAMSLSNLRERYYADLAFDSGGIQFHMINSQAFTWNFYPALATLTITDSDVGEILALSDSVTTIRRSSFTGMGGGIWAKDNSKVTIADSKIRAFVTTAHDGLLTMENTTWVDTPWPIEVVAVDNSQVRLIDPALAPNVTLRVADAGTIEVLHHLDLDVARSGAPVAGADIRVSWRGNGTEAARGRSDATGSLSPLLRELTLTSAGTVRDDSYRIVGTGGHALGERNHTHVRRASIPLDIVDAVLAVSPTNGSTGVARASTITLGFGHSMDPVTTGPAIQVSPAVAGSRTWSADGRNLTITPSGPLERITPYRISVATNATTGSGIAIPLNETFLFTTAPELPGAPTNLTGNEMDGTLGIRWDPPADDGGLPLTGYRLYRDGSQRIELAAAEEMFTDTGLLNGRSYLYSVTALTDAGEGPAARSVRLTPVGLPGPPQNLSGTAGNGTVSLAWDPPAANGGLNVSHYRVYRGGELVADNVTALNFEENGLVNGRPQSYQVTALARGGESVPTSSLVLTPKTLPGVPRKLTATVRLAIVELGWAPPSDDGGSPVTLYRVYRNGTLLAEAAGGSSFVDSRASLAGSYGYEVAAVNSVGEGPPSETAPATLPGLPSAPTGLTAVPTKPPAAAQVRLSWQPPADSGGLPVIAYGVQRDGTEIARVTGTSFTDENVTAGDRHTYRIIAETALGLSAPSAEAHASLRAPEPPRDDTWGASAAVGVLSLVAMLVAVGALIFLLRVRKRAQTPEPAVPEEATEAPVNPAPRK